MSSWDELAEARIQEWLRRSEPERPRAAADSGAVPPLEVQLLQEILDLYTEAVATTGSAAKGEALKRAAELETRLFIMLERSDRPLAAQHLAGLLQKVRGRCR